MTTMIERVALRLATKQMARDQAHASNSGNDVQLVVDGYMAWAREMARAAIEAMREPTEGMHEAAECISVYYDDFSLGDGNITLGFPGYREKFNQVWQQLITAALKEKP